MTFILYVSTVRYYRRIVRVVGSYNLTLICRKICLYCTYSSWKFHPRFSVSPLIVLESFHSHCDNLSCPLQIKTDVARKDDELEHLEQAVHAERTKATRLDTLIRKRGTASGGMSVQGPGSSAGGKPSVVSGSTDSPVPRSLKVKATPNSTAGVGRVTGKEAK
jgi:hypothetical protein